MGGYGSGRRSFTRLYVEDLLKLDACQLHRSRAFYDEQGTPFHIEAGAYWYEAGVILCPSMTITYRGQTCRIQQDIEVIWKSVLGGRATRPYFVCPLSGRTVGTLYLGHAGFGCRQHYGLIYRQQDQSKANRIWAPANRLRYKLEAPSSSHYDPIPKPKGMHWRTYNRLMEEYHNKVDPAINKSMARLDRKIARLSKGL